MTQEANHRKASSELKAAADWVLRLRAPDAGEADWLAFDSWLSAAPGNRAVFDVAEALWMELDARAEEIAEALHEARPVRKAYGGWLAPVAGAFAAVAALALFAPHGVNLFGVHATTYATDKGQRRTIQLADGTRVDLNSGSSLSVKLDRNQRDVVMNDAEAAFDVTHDATRPFIIHVGDQTVRVVGTQFDVSHRDGMISVTVRRGVVRVSPKAGGETVALTVGQRLQHREGEAGSTIDPVVADDAFAWREGRLICRDEALPTVVADLNRYFQRPIRIQDDRLASLRFSGVLTIDDEHTTLQRLADLLPLSATPSEGVIMLKSREPAR